MCSAVIIKGGVRNSFVTKNCGGTHHSVERTSMLIGSFPLTSEWCSVALKKKQSVASHAIHKQSKKDANFSPLVRTLSYTHPVFDSELARSNFSDEARRNDKRRRSQVCKMFSRGPR